MVYRSRRRSFAVIAVLTAAASAQAATPHKLCGFTVSSGYNASGDLAAGPAGLLYGTAAAGGANLDGTVFTFNASSKTFMVIHDFQGGTDGATPLPGLVGASSGMLYGTTQNGGTASKGTVFQIDPSTGVVSVVYSFGIGQDGAFPVAKPALDQAGHLYGVTSDGGTFGHGTIYEIDTSTSTETVLYNFPPANKGGPPSYPGLLIVGSDGKLYGTSAYGGEHDNGTLFAFDPINTTMTILHSFSGNSAGNSPPPLLVAGQNEQLYGTTTDIHDIGEVFSIDTSGKGYKILYTLGDGTPYPVGSFSFVNYLSYGADGDLYGTSALSSATTAGTTFRLDPKTDTAVDLAIFPLNTGGNTPTPYGATRVGKSVLCATARGTKGSRYGGLYTLKAS